MALPIWGLLSAFNKIMDFAKWMAGFIDRRKAKQEGRTERDLEVQTETTEVLSRQNEAGNLVDQMSDQEVDEEFKKL